MTGTKGGGLKACETNRKKYGKDFYKNIGRIGGHNGHTGGFTGNPELARIAGAKGGRKSRRGSAYVYTATSADSTITGSAKELAKILGCSVETIARAYKCNKDFSGYKITRRK